MVKPYVKGIIREDPPKARAKGRKGGQRVVIVRESPPKAHAKGRKGGQKVIIVRESPPKAHAKGRKGGQRVVIVRESPPKAHPKSIKGGQKVTKPESITIKSCPQTERLIRPLPLWWLGHKWCRSLCSQRSYSGRSF